LPFVVLLKNLHEIDGHGEGGIPLLVFVDSDVPNQSSFEPGFLPGLIQRRFFMRVSGVNKPLGNPPPPGSFFSNETHLDGLTTAPNGDGRRLFGERIIRVGHFSSHPTAFANASNEPRADTK